MNLQIHTDRNSQILFKIQFSEKLTKCEFEFTYTKLNKLLWVWYQSRMVDSVFSENHNFSAKNQQVPINIDDVLSQNHDF